MASAKRERKREGQAARRAALEAQRKKEQQRRTLIRTGLIVAAVLVLGLIITTFATRGGKKKTDLTAGSSTTVAADPSTTISPLAVTPGKAITGDTPCPAADGSAERTTSFAKAPPTCIDAAKTYVATFTTDVGVFKAQLDPKRAPKTVNNLVVLARYHFFDGIAFHRVIPGFVIQGGDPKGTGGGDPGYKFEDELPKQGEYKDGSLAMANSGANTNGSQFFVIDGEQGRGLPPSYSLFGQVTDGMDVVGKIMADGDTSGTPKTVHKMQTVTITES